MLNIRDHRSESCMASVEKKHKRLLIISELVKMKSDMVNKYSDNPYKINTAKGQ